MNDLEFGELLEDSTWQDAMDWASGLGDGWRLPTKEELEAICHSDRHDEYATNGYFWSSSSYVYGTSYAWYVGFGSGSVSEGGKAGTNNARCVRLGPKNSDKVFDSTEASDYCTDDSHEAILSGFGRKTYPYCRKCQKEKAPDYKGEVKFAHRCAKCGGSRVAAGELDEWESAPWNVTLSGLGNALLDYLDELDEESKHTWDVPKMREAIVAIWADTQLSEDAKWDKLEAYPGFLRFMEEHFGDEWKQPTQAVIAAETHKHVAEDQQAGHYTVPELDLLNTSDEDLRKVLTEALTHLSDWGCPAEEAVNIISAIGDEHLSDLPTDELHNVYRLLSMMCDAAKYADREEEFSDSWVAPQASHKIAKLLLAFVQQKDPIERKIASVASKDYQSKIKKKIVLDTDVVYTADVAETPAQKTAGLEVFSSLEDKQGLLFPFDPPDHVTFHMGSVRFPIDIIFLTEDHFGLRVAKIVHNAQPGVGDFWSSQDTHFVLEIPGGSCHTNGIEVGSRAVISEVAHG